MSILPHSEILMLHEAAISARIFSSRATLLSGIQAEFVAKLPDAATPWDQIFRDLAAMNEAGKLADGSVPLTIWLMSAIAITDGRKEADVFRSALDRANARASQADGMRGLATAEVRTDGPDPRASDSAPREPRRKNHVFTRLFPHLVWKLASLGVLELRARDRRVLDYLEVFVAQTEKLCRAEPVYVPAHGCEIPPPAAPTEYHPAPTRGVVARNVKRAIGAHSEEAPRSELPTAELQEAKRISRLVQDVCSELMRREEPLILLGDPGSGKSMTIKRVGLELARRQLQTATPSAVVHVQLGQYRSVKDDGTPRDVLDLVRSSLSSAHPSIAALVSDLVDERRLIVLFDGMDEMDRRLYDERVAALSDFAVRYRGRAKILFACRTNDFRPEFQHRQIAILPFDRGQICEFVERNVALPVEVDGKRYSAPALVEQIFEQRALPDLAKNPLLLFLLCAFIQKDRTWPRSRSALLGAYVDRLIYRLTYHAGQDKSPPDSARLISKWAEIGFEISMQGAGAYARREGVEIALDADDAGKIVGAGIDCGLLVVDPETDAYVGFSHQRLQEYFTALHLSRRPDLADWKSMLAAPRWQETLLDLVSLASSARDYTASHRALHALSATFEEIESGALTLETERRVADNLVIASHVIREVAADPHALPKGFFASFVYAVTIMAKIGHPTSQMKILWWCMNVPDLPAGEILAAPLRSKVDCVWEHALASLATSDPTRHTSLANLGTVLANDLMDGRLLPHLPAYLRASYRGRRPSWLVAVGWAVGVLLFTAMLHAAWPLVIYGLVRSESDVLLFLVGPIDEGPWLHHVAELLRAPNVTRGCLALMMITIGYNWRNLRAFPWRAVLVVTTGALAVGIAVSQWKSGGYPLHAIKLASRACGYCWGAGAVTAAVARTMALGVFAVPVELVGGSNVAATRRKTLSSAEQGLLVIVCVSLLYRLINALVIAVRGLPQIVRSVPKEGTNSLWDGSTFTVVSSIAFGLIMLLPISGGVRFLIEKAREGRFGEIIAICAAGVVVGGIFLSLVFNRTFPLLGIVLAIVLIPVLVWRFLSVVVPWLLSFSPKTPRSREQVVELISGSSPGYQAAILRRVTRESLGMTADEFVAFFASLEPHIEAEPALSEYWRRRHDAEQGLGG